LKNNELQLLENIASNPHQEVDMKLVTFEVDTIVGPTRRIGVLRDGGIIDLHAAYSAYLKESRRIYRWQELSTVILPPDMLKFIEGGEISREAVQYALEYFEKAHKSTLSQHVPKLYYKIEETRLLAPVPRPLSIRDGVAFLQHIRNMSGIQELPEVYNELIAHYRTSTTDVVGHDAPILWPSYTEKLDYEVEITVCIGKQGTNVKAEAADEYIFGYTVFNDISARDIQRKEMQMLMGPAKGKSFINSNIMGPCLVTPDEIDVNDLRMLARVNGELWSEGNTKDMHFKFPQIIEYLSKDDTIFPGEFIASGTVGFGSGIEVNKWLKPGDVVELEIEGIGVLRNKVERHA
jgi:2-keto-4-pentenoate hydratase/2-oxohepta-3-ene-1,7-dioic acid hydratase in catechol pathway